MRLPLRRFTAEGLKRFELFLDSAAPDMMPLEGQLLDSEVSEEIPGITVLVDLGDLPDQCTKFELATFIATRIPSIAVQSLLVDDANAGAFMVAARFEVFAKRDSSGAWRLRGRERYIPRLDSASLFYRHPVSALALYTACGPASEVCLYTDCREQGDFMEQVASRADVACNVEMMRVLNHLYWNAQAKSLKAGVLETRYPYPDGCLRRFVGPGSFVERFGTTHDFFSMTFEEILALLPPEFDRFKH